MFATSSQNETIMKPCREKEKFLKSMETKIIESERSRLFVAVVLYDD